MDSPLPTGRGGQAGGHLGKKVSTDAKSNSSFKTKHKPPVPASACSNYNATSSNCNAVKTFDKMLDENTCGSKSSGDDREDESATKVDKAKEPRAEQFDSRLDRLENLVLQFSRSSQYYQEYYDNDDHYYQGGYERDYDDNYGNYYGQQTPPPRG